VIIDGRPVRVAAGASVLEAAQQAGIDIPTLCHHPALPPEGSCRLCLVEVEGQASMHAACVLPADDRLVVRTTSDALEAARRSTLGLLLARYRPAAARDDDRLLALAQRCGVVPRPVEAGGSWPVDESNPFVRVDRGACVRCWRCVRACASLNGVGAIGVFGRGEDTWIGFGADRRMHESACEFCGMCEAVCPTGALSARPPLPTEVMDGPTVTVSSVCGYCAVGCRLAYHVRGGRIVGTAPEWEAPANHGLACAKGRFGWSFVHHPERLAFPLVRRALVEDEGDDLIETDWETALDVVASRLVEIRDRDGGDAIGFLASAKCSNEENYLYQKLARQLFRTNNVDHCARLCHAPTLAALNEALGSGAMTNSMDDIVEHARCVFVIGSNTTEQHPVLGMRLRRAARERGLPIIVADPRRIPLVDVAALHLPLRPGTDVALLNALAHELIANAWVDHDFVEARTEGLEALRDAVRDDTPEHASRITGVPAVDIRRAARMLSEHRPGALLFSMGVTQHTSGTANVYACANLQLLLGNLGVPGGGVNPLRGQNNVQGACDMGALPAVLPGYQPVTDEAARQRFEAAWGARLPGRPGFTVTEMLDAALDGRVRALWIVGENAAMTEPDLVHARRCLAACEFVVVQEIFPSETAVYADVVLPAAAAAERAGTFTSTERRVQRFDPAVAPPGDARPDWWTIAEVARRVQTLTPLHADAPYAGWRYTGPDAVMDEVAALTLIYGGVSHARLGRSGLQWPCPTPGHPGTPILHGDGVPRGRARLVPVRWTPPAEVPDANYPLVLTTGRVLHHYHGGTMTRRVEGLDWLVPEAVAELNALDASERGVTEGAVIRVSSRRGAIVVRARVSERIAQGTVFLPFHFAEAAANLLTNPKLDPVSKIPEFKVCAVQVQPAQRC
jgi:formate dehydrogenase alpha subunit